MIGEWMEVTEFIRYGYDGSYEITITRMRDQEVLFSYSDQSIINWREGTEFVRPKWGIYRSLDNAQDLRDEEVLYSDFSIEELSVTSAQDVAELDIDYANLISGNLIIRNLPPEIHKVQLFSTDGKLMIDSTIQNASEVNLNIAGFQSGIYAVRVVGRNIEQSKLIVVQ